MAWLKIDYQTPDKPEMLAVAADLGVDPDLIFAAWFRLYRWADANLLADGYAAGATLAQLSRISGIPGLAEAFTNTGWLRTKNGGVEFCNFDKHNGNSAKQRGLSQKRMLRSRRNATATGSTSKSSSLSTPSRGSAEGEKWDEKIYQLYPRKVGRASAIKAINAALKRLSADSNITEPPHLYLIEKTQTYAASAAGQPPPTGQTDYRPHPATWFNAERYHDDPREWMKNGNPPSPTKTSRVTATPGKYAHIGKQPKDQPLLTEVA